MDSRQVQTVLKDLIPSFSLSYPSQLISYIDTTYRSSLRQIGTLKNDEIARYHICAVIAIEKLQYKYNLPQPDIGKIPVRPKTAMKLINDFKSSIFKTSANSSPVKFSNPSTPRTSSRMLNATPNSKSSSRKRDRSTSPTPSGKRKPVGVKSNSNSPLKMSDNALLHASTTPKRGSPLKKTEGWILDSTASSRSSPLKKKVDPLTYPVILAFASKFNIPPEVTPNVLVSITQHRIRYKNEWALLCGLVALIFLKVNKTKLESQAGLRHEFINKLYNLQEGGLSKSTMLNYIEITEGLISSEKWIKELDIKYNKSIDRVSIVGDNLVVSEVQYSSIEQIKAYQNWKNKIVKILA